MVILSCFHSFPQGNAITCSPENLLANESNPYSCEKQKFTSLFPLGENIILIV